MTENEYTVDQLDRLIHNALILGFMDDVRHWQRLRSERISAGLRQVDESSISLSKGTN